MALTGVPGRTVRRRVDQRAPATRERTRSANTPTIVVWNARLLRTLRHAGITVHGPMFACCDSTLASLALIDEPDVWNSSYAFQFPSVGVDARALCGTYVLGHGASFRRWSVSFGMISPVIRTLADGRTTALSGTVRATRIGETIWTRGRSRPKFQHVGRDRAAVTCDASMLGASEIRRHNNPRGFCASSPPIRLIC